jgi:hypothetical protein
LTMHRFHTFFNQIDNFRNPAFLWVSARGRAASGPSARSAASAGPESFKSRNKHRAKIVEERRNRQGKWAGRQEGAGEGASADAVEVPSVEDGEGSPARAIEQS